MSRTQFTFYESFFVAVSKIRKAADRAKAYDILCSYALYGTEPDVDALPDAVAIAFLSFRPVLDAAARKSRGGKMERCGEDTGKITARCGEDTGKITQRPREQEKEIEQVKEQDKEKDKEKEEDKEQKLTRTRTRFVPPTVEQVRAYCQEQGNGVDPAQFVDFYTTKGWKVGKNPMVDWKAAVRTWERRDRGGGKPAPGTREPDADEIAAVQRMMAGEAG